LSLPDVNRKSSLRVISQIIQGIEPWQSLRGSRANEEVGEAIHFVGPEKQGAAYRLIVVRKRNNQRALFPEFEYTAYVHMYPRKTIPIL